MEFLSNNTIQIEPPKRPKKLTGTKFAAVLGLNKWNTPFKEWCAITRTYEEPFVDNKYTIAGKVIEPKVAEYLQKLYFLDDLTSPTDVWGKDYFKKTYGNFFDDKVFGGMWDFKGDDYVVEVKTSSRPQDWEDEPPMYYLLQVCLYAYLMEVDTIYLTVSFLEEKDYEDPDKYIPTPDNTKIYEYSLSKDFPDFVKEYVEPALEWWNEHIVKGISPEFTDKDNDIIKELKTQYLPPDDNSIKEVLKELSGLYSDIEKIKKESGLDEKEKQVTQLKNKVKSYLENNIKSDMEKITASYEKYDYTLARSVRTGIDKEQLKKDGLLPKYITQTESTTLRVVERKEEK